MGRDDTLEPIRRTLCFSQDLRSDHELSWPENRPVFLTVRETAHLLRTSRKAVYALIERRQIPGVVRLGRRVLVRSDELLEFLRQKSECHR